MTLMDNIPRFKHTEARFSSNLTDSLCLPVAQVPRPRDMVIFLLTTTTTTTTTTTQPITLPLTHARGVINITCNFGPHGIYIPYVCVMFVWRLLHRYHETQCMGIYPGVSACPGHYSIIILFCNKLT